MLPFSQPQSGAIAPSSPKSEAFKPRAHAVNAKPALWSSLCQPGAPAEITRHGQVQLSFEGLTEFESVRNQYRHQGVVFDGAIAIYPSNPAFQSQSPTLALVPATTNLTVTLYFRHPVRQVGALVTGAKPVHLRIFDKGDRLLAHHSIGHRQSLQPCRTKATRLSSSSYPQHRLAIEAEGIAKAIFEADSPFLLNQFFCLR